MEFLFFWRVVLPRPERLALFHARCDKTNIVQLASFWILAFLTAIFAFKIILLGIFFGLVYFPFRDNFFFVLSQEKNSNNCWFLALCVMRGGIFASCLVNCKAYGWRLLNEKPQHFTVLQSWFIVANKEWEKYERCLSFFYITSSVTKWTLHLNDLSEWVQPRLKKAPQYNQHYFVIAAVCLHGFTRFSLPRRFRTPHIWDVLTVRTTRVQSSP